MVVKIRKAVYPVAGLGTRFLPATKANPKEMLPIVDKPLIQYAVEEAAACGITEHIFVTSSSKRAIEDHFDTNHELETKLLEAGKHELLDLARSVLPSDSFCVYIRQANPLGLGHAILCAKDVVGDEPFAIFLADDLIDAAPQNCMAQMLDAYYKTSSSILALQKVPHSETVKYGIVGVDDRVLEFGQTAKVRTIIEKPVPAEAPSQFAVVGRYILTSKIFEYLEKIEAGAVGEIQLTDGILHLLGNEDVYGYLFNGTRYDCGSKLGYLEATIAYARKHPEVGKEFESYLRQFCSKL
jgi:UTP--glucose-1-phosphate uridylyltransferase